MPIPLRLSFLPPLSSAGLSVDAVDITDRQYNFLFGDDQIPVIHLSASPATPNSLTTYKTSVSALTSFFPWDLTIINPGNLSPGGFNWTTTGDLSTYGGINILNTVGNGRNFFLSGVGVNTIPKLGEYSFTIVEKTTAGIILRSDETRGPQLVIGLDPENHGTYVQGGKFSGFRFPRPLIFRLATPAATEHMRLDANAFLGIGDSQFPPVKLTVRGSISAGRGFNNFTQTTSGGSISAVGNVVNFFGGPVCIGTNILQRFPGIDAGNINSIQALVVGGGGGGGGWGGGGGAGGVVAGTYSVTPGTNYAVTVGNGGTRGAGPTYTVGGNGGNSSIASLATAVGGGGGGNWSAGNGRNGGSGGGGSGTGIGGTGTAGQGFNGGAGGSAGSTPYFGHGGGGGAGGVGGTRQGSNLTVGGNGGPGVLSNITGTPTYYGGGGGGHSPGNASGLNNTQVGLGGIGGGGNGGRFYSPGLAAQDGQPNTGGGGGGAYGDVGQLCGNGGTGVVVIRYVGPPRATGGDSVYSYNDGSTTYTVHVFSSVGTSNFTVFNTSIMENAPSLVVIGSISATGNLSATRLDTFNSVRGRLGIGTNTFNNNDLRLAVIGDVLTESGSLSVVDPARFVYLASKLGVGVNSYTDAANGLTVVGNISATGSLSATGDSFSSFYGNVGISIPATGSSIQHYSQALTVRGSISSTGAVSAVDALGFNYFGGSVGIGTNAVALGQRLTVVGNISSTGSLSAISFTNTNNFNYLASKLGIGTNTFEGQNLQLAVIGSISGTGSVSATDLNAFNVFRGYTGIGTNARQRYGDRSFSWSTSNNIGATNAISTGLNSVYVAGRSSSPYFYFSNNSPNIWLSASEPAGTSSIKSIAFGGRFVALESGASLKTYYSNNGTAWVAGGSLPLSLEWGGVSFGNGIFLATSTNITNRTAYSTNSGINWSLGGNLPANGNWSKPVYNPAYNSWLTTRGVFWDFVAISNNNGITWSQIPVGFALDWTDAVFVPPNYYVLLGGSDNRIAYSSNNGVSFTVVNLPVSDQWNAIAAGSIRGINYAFITATNSNRVLYSSDLNNWFLLPQLPATKDWTNLTYNTSGVLAVASDGTSTIGNFFIDDYRHLNVVGTVSATGALSATHTTDFNFIGGQVVIGGKPPTVPIVNQNDRPAFNQKLTVLGNISATGTLSAADTAGRGVSFFGGRLGVGTNNTYDQRLTVLGNISSTGSLTAMDFAQGNDFNYIGGRLGVGPNANTSRAFNNYLTVVGNVSARGALSADSTDYNFIGGRVMIGGKPPTLPVINQNDRPAFNQKLTVVGNISSTGALSATNSSGVSIFGRLAVGTNSSYGQRLTVLGNISSTGALSAICAINNPLTDTTFNYFAGQVGIGTNQIPDSSIQLAVIGSVSATGSLSAMDMDRFNFIGGNLQVGPIVNSPFNAPASVQRLTVVGNISSTGTLSATDLDGINVFGRHVHIGPVNFQNINLNHNLTVVGNLSSTGTLSAIGNTNFNTFNYFAGQVGIGTNEITDPSVELSITGNLSAQGTLSAGNMLNFNYFGSPVGIGTNTFEGRDNLELTVIGNVSATGSLSAVGTDISYLSSRLVIAPVSLFGSASSVNYSFNTGLTVFGAISSNESLSARSIYTNPLIFNYTAPTVGTQLVIPRGFNYIKIIGIGGGGGGGSGRRNTTTGTPKYGGGGGGGGDYVEMIIPLKKLSSQVIFVTAGLGGVGGAAQATSPANGNEGFNGAATAVAVDAATNPPIFIARGGRGGKGGTNFAETSLGGKSGGKDSGDGADPAVLTFSTATEYLSYTLASEAAENGGSGGGAGGSINANNNNTTGLIGFSALPGGSAGGNNQISRNGQTGTAGANGVSIAFSNTSENIWGGAGGGGGGASTTGAGGTGGAGALGGGGGGGGGASSSASSSGAGGNGGNGYLRILIY